MNLKLDKSLACFLLLSVLTVVASAQVVQLTWAKTLNLEGSSVLQIAPIPGDDFLAVTGNTAVMSLARVTEAGSIQWQVKPFINSLCATVKILPDNNAYFVAGGANAFIGKYNLTTGALVNSFSDPKYALAADLGPDLTAYFVEESRSDWAPSPAGSPDINQQTITTTLLRVSNTLVSSSWSVSHVVYGDNNRIVTYGFVPNYARFLFYKGQVYCGVEGRYTTGSNSKAQPYLVAWALNSSGSLLWAKDSVLDTSTVAGGPHYYFPYRLGFDLSGNFTAAYGVTDGSGGPPYIGVTFNGATGASMTYSGTSDLAEKEYATGGFWYREFTDLFAEYLRDDATIFWYKIPAYTSLEKRNATDTSTIWSVNSEAIYRLPFQIIDVWHANGNGQPFDIRSRRDVDLAGVDTAVHPPSYGNFSAIGQQQDTGTILAGAVNPDGFLFFTHLITQPVLNSATYAVPKNTVYNSPNSIFFADRFTAGLSPQIGAYVKHGTLVLHTDGTFVYTPTHGFTGTDFFIYRVQRSGLPTVSAEIAFNVS